jgi:hypothetical protein
LHQVKRFSDEAAVFVTYLTLDNFLFTALLLHQKPRSQRFNEDFSDAQRLQIRNHLAVVVGILAAQQTRDAEQSTLGAENDAHL